MDEQENEEDALDALVRLVSNSQYDTLFAFRPKNGKKVIARLRELGKMMAYWAPEDQRELLAIKLGLSEDHPLVNAVLRIVCEDAAVVRAEKKAREQMQEMQDDIAEMLLEHGSFPFGRTVYQGPERRVKSCALKER